MIVKKNNGITLASLAVVIIVLLILSGVGLNILLSQHGIINNVNNANIKYLHAQVWGAMQIQYTNYDMIYHNTSKDFIEYLKEKNIITDVEGNHIISIEQLLGSRGQLGNGTDGKNDVYTLEEIVGETENNINKT